MFGWLSTLQIKHWESVKYGTFKGNRGQIDINRIQMQTYFVSKVDFGKSERSERRVGLSDDRLDVVFKEFLHVHPKERPGLFQHLNIQSKTERVKTP